MCRWNLFSQSSALTTGSNGTFCTWQWHRASSVTVPSLSGCIFIYTWLNLSSSHWNSEQTYWCLSKKKYYYFHLQVSPTRCLVSRDQNGKKIKNVRSGSFKAHSHHLPRVWCVRVAEKAPKAGLLINQNDPLKMKLRSPRAAAVPGRWSVLFSSQLWHRIVDAVYWGGNIREQTACSLCVCVGGNAYAASASAGERWMNYEFWAIYMLKRHSSSLFCSRLL